MAASHACKASKVEGQPTDSGVLNAVPKKASELAHGTPAAQAIMAGLIQAGASKKLIIDAVGKIMKSSMTNANTAGSISLEVSEDVKQRLTKVIPSMIIQDEHQTGHLRDIVAAPHSFGLENDTRPTLTGFKEERDSALHNFPKDESYRQHPLPVAHDKAEPKRPKHTLHSRLERIETAISHLVGMSHCTKPVQPSSSNDSAGDKPDAENFADGDAPRFIQITSDPAMFEVPASALDALSTMLDAKFAEHMDASKAILSLQDTFLAIDARVEAIQERMQLLSGIPEALLVEQAEAGVQDKGSEKNDSSEDLGIWIDQVTSGGQIAAIISKDSKERFEAIAQQLDTLKDLVTCCVQSNKGDHADFKERSVANAAQLERRAEGHDAADDEQDSTADGGKSKADPPANIGLQAMSAGRRHTGSRSGEKISGDGDDNDHADQDESDGAPLNQHARQQGGEQDHDRPIGNNRNSSKAPQRFQPDLRVNQSLLKEANAMQFYYYEHKR